MTTDWILSDPLFRLPAEWVHPAIANAFPCKGKVAKTISSGNCFRRMRWNFPCVPHPRLLSQNRDFRRSAPPIIVHPLDNAACGKGHVWQSQRWFSNRRRIFYCHDCGHNFRA